MKDETAIQPGSEERRELLKKIGAVGAFAVPAIATFKLSELKVHASGFGSGDLDKAWDSYWGQHTDFFGSGVQFWSQARETWYRIWMLLNP